MLRFIYPNVRGHYGLANRDVQAASQEIGNQNFNSILVKGQCGNWIYQISGKKIKPNHGEYGKTASNIS
jgi:hypothetical protein